MRRLVALVLVLAVLAPAPAGAHVELIESDPPVDGEATEGLTSVVMTMAAFDPDRPVEVEITDPAGEDVTAGEPDVDTRATVAVPTEPLQAGQHIVHWHAWADDGDGESEGTYTFTVVESPETGWGIWLIWIAALGIPAAILLRPGARRSRAD
jgi:methionine-rich copper-binding protein CopC